MCANMVSKLITDFFLGEHRVVHRSSATGTGGRTVLDRLLADITDEQIQQMPEGAANSIAWLLFHATRVEDVVFNVLIAGDSQVCDQDDWQARTSIERRDIGTGMTEAKVASLSASVNVQSLLDYRDAVGRKTREIVASRPAEFWEEYADTGRLRDADLQGVAAEMGSYVLEQVRTTDTSNASFLWFATSHALAHFGEARETRRIVTAEGMD